MRTNLFRRAAAASASAALAVTGLAALAPAANAVDTEVSLKFNCSASILQDQEFVFDATVSGPESVRAGEDVEISFDGTVTAPPTVRGAAYSLLNGRFLEGTADVQGTFGTEAITLGATVPRTEISGTAGDSLILPVTGGTTFTATEVGVQDVTIPGFTADLIMTKADDSTSPLEVTCEAKDPSAVAGTVTVEPGEVTPAKVASTTKIKKAKFAKKKKRINVTAQVRTADKKAAKGKVKVTLKKGKKTVKVIKGKKLNKKGIAKVKFNKIAKKGKYKVIVQYQGNKQTKKSKKNAVVRVK